MTSATIPQAFVWRRLHSLAGLWLVLFLMEHLLTNSQAALLLGDNARGFINMVNGLHNLPYLEAIEIFLLGFPILIHLVLGIKILLTAKFNSFGNDKSKPVLPEYGRNRAYTWQRITSWILLVCLIGHVVKFRFLEYPLFVNEGETSSYFVRLHLDDGLYTVSDRLGVKLYDASAVEEEAKKLASDNSQMREKWVRTLEKKSLGEGEVIAVSKDFGTATLLTVRDTFKSPIYVGIYTIFVLAACFHGFNGFWTFLMSWGIILKMSAQKAAAKLSIALMLLVTFLGLMAIWGTYATSG